MSDRKSTPREVRKFYKQIRRQYDKLYDSILAAYRLNIIVYPKEYVYKDDAVCAAMDEVLTRFKRHTKAALAEAMEAEIMRDT